MKRQGKWFAPIRSDDTIESAARVTLKSRLKMVEKLLKRAACDGPFQDPENVHQLRVWSRRSLAAIELYRSVLPTKDLRWFRKRLRQIRKTAGTARDLDVFLHRYQDDRVLRKAGVLRLLRKERRRTQRPIQKLYRKLIANRRFRKRTRRLLKPYVASRDTEDACFGPWSRCRMTATAREFFDHLPREPYDLTALHRFRVRGKRLRYTMELLASAFPPERHRLVHTQVTELQNRLGNLNDHATACRNLKRWSKTSKTRELRACFDHLLAVERGQLDHSIACFRKWWTPGFASHLETALHAMTAAGTDVDSSPQPS